MSEYRALAAYEGEAAREYERTRFRSMRGRLTDGLEWRLIRRGLGRLGWRDGEDVRVLDVPVGTGRMASRLSRAGCTVTGIDASADMLSEATSRSSASRYLLGRIEELPLDSASVDYAVCVRLFGHLPPDAKDAALRELARVSARGCVVCFPGDTRLLRARRSRQARSGRRLDSWFPMSRRHAEAMARAAGFADAETLAILGPFGETRALVLHSPRGPRG